MTRQTEHNGKNTVIRHSQAKKGTASQNTTKEKTERPNRENHTQNLNPLLLTINETGSIMPETPETALVAAQAYLLTTQPEPGDPRESMHQAAIKGLGLIRDKLQQKPWV
jgi:hypothetical protein